MLTPKKQDYHKKTIMQYLYNSYKNSFLKMTTLFIYFGNKVSLCSLTGLEFIM